MNGDRQEPQFDHVVLRRFWWWLLQGSKYVSTKDEMGAGSPLENVAGQGW